MSPGIRSKPVDSLFELRYRDNVFPLAEIPRKPDGETATEPLADLRNGISLITCLASKKTVIKSVPEFLRVALCTGIKKGKHGIIGLKHKKIDILFIVMIGKKPGDIGLKRLYIDLNTQGRARGLRVYRML